MDEKLDETSLEQWGWGRMLGIAALVLFAALFSFFNAGEMVSVNIGFTVLYRISLVGLVFAVFLLGMLTMFLFGLRHDRRVRAALRDQQVASRPEPPYLFDTPPEPEPPA
jgi:hypothetical protein